MSVLFQGTVPVTTPVYVPVPIKNGTIGVHIGWADATSAAVITLQLSSLGPTSTTAAGWKDSGLTIVGPVASAIGSTLLNVEIGGGAVHGPGENHPGVRHDGGRATDHVRHSADQRLDV